MIESLSSAQVQTWRTFILAHALLIERIDSLMVQAHQLPLPWYDVLIELNNAPERRLRMHELADRVILTRSRVTRLVDRLEAEGLLARERSRTDRRGAYAVLTDRGVAALRQAWPVYEQGIATCFAQHLTEAQRRTLAAALERMIAHVQATSAVETLATVATHDQHVAG